MALTASAPPACEGEITGSLFMTHPAIVKQNLDRTNIYLSVGTKFSVRVSCISRARVYSAKISLQSISQRDFMGLRDGLKTCSDPHRFPKTVVFCRSKETVSKLFRYLKHAAVSSDCVAMYHANLSEGTKSDIYTKFSSPTSTLCCLVSTIAFGMVSFVKMCLKVRSRQPYTLFLSFRELTFRT